MSIIKNNAAIVAMCGQRLIALKKYMKAKTGVKVSGKLMKLADLVDVYQACIDARTALVPVRIAYEKALAVRDGAEASRQETDRKLKAWVMNEFDAGSPEALEFGFLPPKVRAATAQTKADAVKLGKATREARGTMGKREKLKIKGSLDPAAPADPATTATAAAPATVATTATNGTPSGAPSSNGSTTHS